VPGTSSAYPERTLGGYYLDITSTANECRPLRPDRTGDVQDVISTALGGMQISTAVEGLERYPINVVTPVICAMIRRAFGRCWYPTPLGAQIPLGELAGFKINPGPPMIKSENARRSAWVYVDVNGRDVGSYIADAQRRSPANCSFPPVTRWPGPGSSSRFRNPTRLALGGSAHAADRS
jgi:Cu(I)/Ag(I) efflux system membrane protein CusA/SilA